MPHLQNSNVDCIEERRFSSGSLTIFMVHYHLLLANWPSLWYTTIFFLPTGHLYGTPSIVYWHTGYHYGPQPSSTDALAVPLVHYCLLLAKWPSLWYTPIFYWSFGSPRGTLPSSTGPPYVRLLSSPGPVAQSYGTLTFSTSPLAVSVVHYYFLLVHRLSLWYTRIFLWPTGPS